MNPLQTGTPASSLSPQGYKNSTQEGTVQGTLNSSDVQSSNDDLLQVKVPGKLKVVTGNNTVLGASTTAKSNVAVQNQVQSSGVPMFAVLFLIVSVVGAVYFFRRYMNLPSLAEVQEEDEE